MHEQLSLGFEDTAEDAGYVCEDRVLAPGVTLLGGFASASADVLLDAIADVARVAPFRSMTTPGGRRMSVVTTSCGPLGWVSDEAGYRYSPCDPDSGHPWPALPDSLRALARGAAERAGFAGFEPDACLVNRYEPGTRMGLHQDKDERDFGAPIVSVSLGLPALFLLGGERRSDRPQRLPLVHGDVLVWGGPARLRFHGVLPIAEGWHAKTRRYRFNLTLRKAG
jgi:alkylated DNA repair protein (DNA oxidative demethylase)